MVMLWKGRALEFDGDKISCPDPLFVGNKRPFLSLHRLGGANQGLSVMVLFI